MILDRFMGKARTAQRLLLQQVRPPRARERVSQAIALWLPDAESDARGEAAAEKIRTDGFVALDRPVPPHKLRRVRAELEKKPCFDAWRPERGFFPLDCAPKDSSNAHVADVASIREAVEIANEPFILSAVSAYLGCKPTIDDILAWWSLPRRPAPLEEQFFHRDQDSIRFVKLFIYLSNVGEDDGPHVFVRGSHRSNVLLEGGRRFTDDEVLSRVPAEDIVRFTGPFGTAFLEDTYGLHKGAMPTSGARLLLQVRYTMLPSAFVAQRKIAETAGFDPYMNRFIGGAR